MMRLALIAAFACLLAGCFGEPTSLQVPRDTARQCANHCNGLGMRLGAVVIIMTSAGCVCEPRDRSTVRAGGSAALAGGAAIHAAQEKARRSQQQQH